MMRQGGKLDSSFVFQNDDSFHTIKDFHQSERLSDFTQLFLDAIVYAS